MEYQIEKAIIDDKEKLIEYKLRNIFDYAKDLPSEEVKKINDYVKNNIPKHIDEYKVIKINSMIAGCVLVTNHLDGVLLDEIFIEEEYRNRKIGTGIIKNILHDNDIVYLWVYKDNINAIRLYKKLGFNIENDTDTRYFMKYFKIER